MELTIIGSGTGIPSRTRGISMYSFKKIHNFEMSRIMRKSKLHGNEAYALIVTDMLNDFVNKGAPLEVPKARTIINNIKRRYFGQESTAFLLSIVAIHIKITIRNLGCGPYTP